MGTEVLALVVALASLVVSTVFAFLSFRAARVANQIGENQKTSALLSLLAPAAGNSDAWLLLIKYLGVLERLDIKARIANRRLEVLS